MLTLTKSKSREVTRSVRKANELIEASYRLSLQEQRLLAVMISMIHRDHEKFQTYRVGLKEFAQIVGYKGKSFYNEAIAITERLEKRVITIKDRGKDSLLQIGWISSAEYLNQLGVVEFSIDPKLKNYLLELQGTYKGYALLNALRLRSSYSFRIYELLKQFENIKERRFFLEDFRKILALKKNEYKLYGDFKRRILDSSITEINTTTDLFVSYEARKKGRKVNLIIFTINPNKKNNDIEFNPPKNSKIHNRLVHKFCQTNKQAEEHLKRYSIDQIKLNLEHVERRYKKGEIKNIGAYTLKAIKENIADQKSLFDEEISKNAKAQKEKFDEKKYAEEYDIYKTKIVDDYKELLTFQEINEIEKAEEKLAIQEFGSMANGRKKMEEINTKNKLFKLAGGISFEEWKKKEREGGRVA